jgi:serine/threonine protein kinase
VLFKGSSSYAISPLVQDGHTKDASHVSQNDQVFKILEVFGDKQSLSDDFFESKKMHKFYKFAQDWADKQKPRTLEDVHPGIHREYIEILEECLTLDPKNRCTAEELLNNKLFDDIRGEHEKLIKGELITVKIDQLKLD